jgi:uncharacterized protein YuzE
MPSSTGGSTLRIEYDRETDSLYIAFRSVNSTVGREVEPGIVFDFDANGKVIGIDIENASELTDVSALPS